MQGSNRFKSLSARTETGRPYPELLKANNSLQSAYELRIIFAGSPCVKQKSIVILRQWPDGRGIRRMPSL